MRWCSRRRPVVSDDDEDGFGENDGDCNDRDPGTILVLPSMTCKRLTTDADGDGFGSDEPAAGEYWYRL